MIGGLYMLIYGYIMDNFKNFNLQMQNFYGLTDVFTMKQLLKHLLFLKAKLFYN